MNVLPSYNDFLSLVLAFSTLAAICAVTLLAIERGKSWPQWLALAILLTPAVSLLILVLTGRDNPPPSRTKSKKEQQNLQDEPEPASSSNNSLEELDDAMAEHKKARQSRMAAEAESREQSRILAQIQIDKGSATEELEKCSQIENQTKETLRKIDKIKKDTKKINDRLRDELETLEALREKADEEREIQDEIKRRNMVLRQEIEQLKQEEIAQLKKSRLEGRQGQFADKGLRWK